MTAPSAQSAPVFDWEAAGRDLGSKLDRLNALAVLGVDPEHTARVALGLARQQARRRRVAIGDMLGEVDVLRALAPADDDHHGLADVFDYGVSLDRIARKVGDDGNLFVLPPGAFVGDQAEIFANRRWSRLAGSFRKDGGLLVIAARIDAPEVESLVLQFDGAVLVGERVQTRLPVTRVLGVIRGPQRASRAIRAQVAPPREKYRIRAPRTLRKLGTTVGLTLAAIVCAFGMWIAARPAGVPDWAPAWMRNRGGSSAEAPILRIDSIGAPIDSGLKRAPSMGLLTKMDSGSISPYGIALVSFNTQAGALLELQQHGSSLRAGTFTPVLIRGAPWYRVVAGAYPDSASAAALLDTLRARGTSDAGRAQIEKFPYALLLARDVPDSSVANRVSAWQRRGLPVYALLQTDGTAKIYAGAFKEQEEATSLYEALRSAGISTSLVYRTGRVY